MASVEPEARRGGMLEVSQVHRALEEKVGGEVALYTAYRLLHRYGWRKIASRPRHPQGDPEAQAAFKKLIAPPRKSALARPSPRQAAPSVLPG
jgi:transposase